MRAAGGAKKEEASDAGASTRRLSVTNNSAPSSLPTVFGDEFKGAGQKAGMEVWRIEKLKCIKKLNQANPKDEPPNAGQLAHAGKLCAGDSYIFLHTKVWAARAARLAAGTLRAAASCSRGGAQALPRPAAPPVGRCAC